jgi:hypothetical protein
MERREEDAASIAGAAAASIHSGAEDVKAVYDKIYNAHAAFPCSLMPRLGSNGILSIDQIKDLVALVMSPESPVNK